MSIFWQLRIVAKSAWTDFSEKLKPGTFMKICQEDSDFAEIGQKCRSLVYDYHRTFFLLPPILNLHKSEMV